MIFCTTKGRLLGRWGGIPVVMLTTTDRTGQPRTTMLASPLQEGERIVLVASNGGAPRDPVWLRNLRERPDVGVLMKGLEARMLARIASPEEKIRLWPQITTRSPSYGRYQERTARDIPVVLVEPTASWSTPIRHVDAPWCSRKVLLRRYSSQQASLVTFSPGDLSPTT
jgi:deazaflavin-dependent oxidoreductase (nitroreductase family)